MLAQPQSLGNCSKCGGKLDGSWTETKGSMYHPNCFKCDKCGEALGNIGIFVRVGSNIFCRPCRTQMLGNKQLASQQTQQPQQIHMIQFQQQPNYSNNKTLSKAKPLSGNNNLTNYNQQRKSANNLTNYSNKNTHKNKQKRYSQPPSLYTNKLNAFGGIQTANKLGSDYTNKINNSNNNNTYNNNNNNINNLHSQNNSNHYNEQKEQKQPKQHNQMQQNNNYDQQQPNMYNNNNNTADTNPSEPELPEMTEEEIADWNDHTTANKTRDFLGLSEVKKKQNAAKTNAYKPEQWNNNNNNNNNNNSYEEPQSKSKGKKKKFQLFG